MKSKNKAQKTIYLCFNGGDIIGVASTLPRLRCSTTEMAAKSYHYFYRNLRNRNTFVYHNGEASFKIQRLSYD